ncbi:MAG: hypothetical protein IPI55_01305 [Flavobacteriales bacterium]|nr:hypothetical protein [Flavobacteriales bacterium]
MPATHLYLFLFAVVWAIALLFFATRSFKVLGVAVALAVAQLLLANTGFYDDTSTAPPRALLLLAPSLLLIVVAWAPKGGRRLMRAASMPALVLVHVCRIPVELVLHEAWLHDLVPEAMTYTGSNLDIVSGLSAILVWLYLRNVAHPSKVVLVIWNLLCLGLLFNIVITAVLSLPGPMQVMNHDLPNRLVLTSPYVLLPAVVVPIVLFAHLCALLKLRGDGRT